MKRFAPIITTLLLSLYMSGCSQTGETPSESGQTLTNTTELGTTNQNAVPREGDPSTNESVRAQSNASTNETADTPPTPPVAPTPPTPDQGANTESATDVEEVAVIKTTAGTMVAEFWPDVAPETVKNFKKLAREDFYDGTAFHRIIKGFMIQGGDPLTKDPSKEPDYGTGDPGYKIKAEFNEKQHARGVLSMARGPHPDSAGSQFFVVLDRAPSLDRLYTAFGKVIKGEDVLMKIGSTPVEATRRGELSKPVERIEVQSIDIVPRDEANL